MQLNLDSNNSIVSNDSFCTSWRNIDFWMETLGYMWKQNSQRRWGIPSMQDRNALVTSVSCRAIYIKAHSPSFLFPSLFAVTVVCRVSVEILRPALEPRCEQGILSCRIVATFGAWELASKIVIFTVLYDS